MFIKYWVNADYIFILIKKKTIIIFNYQILFTYNNIKIFNIPQCRDNIIKDLIKMTMECTRTICHNSYYEIIIINFNIILFIFL